MRRHLTILLLVLFSVGGLSAQQLKIVNGYIIIDCSGMPADAVSSVSKGSATGIIDSEAGVSTNGATVFRKFQVAKKDAMRGPDAGSDITGTTMGWPTAVGYTGTYSGNYPADPRLGLNAGTLNAVSPNTTLMRGAPANAACGCNYYSEGTDPETASGKWRVPTKRELILMWIFSPQLEKVEGFEPFSDEDYVSASERNASSCHLVNFANGLLANKEKKSRRKVRCIREIHD